VERGYGIVDTVVSATQGHPEPAIGIDLVDSELAESVQARLAVVERRLYEVVESADPFVTEAAQHLIRAGGKRFRPLLTVVCGHFGDPTVPEIVDSALAVELTHLATLYHDDVMDEAPVRRGAPSVNSRWTNTVAILIGDFLFARASDLVASLGNDAVRLQSRTFSRLVHGQIRETVGPRPGEDPVEHYLHVVTEKTASLISTSARFGALFAGASERTVEALAQFGEAIGIAFQLSDDLLDISADQSQSGKMPGTDLREGVITLPVLYALAGDDRDGARLREIVRGPVTDEVLHAEALDLLRGSEAMRRASETMRSYAEQARQTLAEVPDVPARRALESLCDFVVERQA